MAKLVLCSQSPRRQELLKLFRRPFVVEAADVDEKMDDSQPAFSEVARVSRRKAEAVAREQEDVVIAADTIVVCDGQILGKPKSTEHAVQMLTMLSGRAHQVMTGLTVVRGNAVVNCTEVTDLWFRKLSRKEIEDYVATGEPMDKAGAYGIQGGAALFVQRLEGDYYNVMGLPVCRLWQMLGQIAPEWMEDTQ